MENWRERNDALTPKIDCKLAISISRPDVMAEFKNLLKELPEYSKIKVVDLTDPNNAIISFDQWSTVQRIETLFLKAINSNFDKKFNSKKD